MKKELDDQEKRRTKEFESEGVRLTRTSGRTQRQVAEDLAIGLSTLVCWIRRSRGQLGEDANAVQAPHVTAELKQLWRENKVLRQERHILKKRRLFHQGRKSMKFSLINQTKFELPVQRLCEVMEVKSSSTQISRFSKPVAANKTIRARLAMNRTGNPGGYLV